MKSYRVPTVSQQQPEGSGDFFSMSRRPLVSHLCLSAHESQRRLVGGCGTHWWETLLRQSHRQPGSHWCHGFLSIIWSPEGWRLWPLDILIHNELIFSRAQSLWSFLMMKEDLYISLANKVSNSDYHHQQIKLSETMFSLFSIFLWTCKIQPLAFKHKFK